MSLILTEGERQHIASFEPEERAEYCITQLLKHQEVYGLFGGDGWIMLEAGDDMCFPIWPTAELATDWLDGQLDNVEPKAVSFTEWFEQWLPGMESNGTHILVFPVGHEEEGIILTAEEFVACLEEDDDTESDA